MLYIDIDSLFLWNVYSKWFFIMYIYSFLEILKYKFDLFLIKSMLVNIFMKWYVYYKWFFIIYIYSFLVIWKYKWVYL